MKNEYRHYLKTSCLKAMNKYKENLLISLIIFFSLIGSAFSLWKAVKPAYYKYSKENLKQPVLKAGIYPWSVRSIDTQVVSKHWENVSRESIKEQVNLIKVNGANYVAIGTPYDRLEDMRMWVEEIHSAGMNVWFRSHWIGWEGDEGVPATLKPNEYLEKTKNFIVSNPELFREGDSFAVCVEAENVGIGLGMRFLNWEEFKTFLLNEIFVANQVFEEIGMKGKIHTNWLSVNGWTAKNILNKELSGIIGMVTVDNYVGQTKTIGESDSSEKLVNQTLDDLNTIHEKLNVPILIGEWGYQIYQPVSDVRQANVINQMFMKLRTLDYLIGVNYWVHMGNTSSIFSDKSGSNPTPRLGAEVLRYYFNPLSFVEETGN